MNKRIGIIVLLAVGVGLAIVIGLLGGNDSDSQADAQQSFCSSLDTLESSITSLTGLDVSTDSKSDYESAVSGIDSAWDQVTSDAQTLGSVSMSQLDSAWDEFTSSVGDVPDDASVSDAVQDVTQAAQTLASSVTSTLTGPDCS